MFSLKNASFLAVVLVITIMLCVIRWKDRVIGGLAEENNKLRAELIISQQNTTATLAKLDAQNAKIEKHVLDMAEAEKRYAANLASLRGRAAQTRVDVVKELVKDPSCENELSLIRRQLEAFYESNL